AHPPDLHSFPTRRSSDLEWALALLTQMLRAANPDQPIEHGHTKQGNKADAGRDAEGHAAEPECEYAARSRHRHSEENQRRQAERSEEHTSELQSRENLVC